jgi:hypothetical protein
MLSIHPSSLGPSVELNAAVPENFHRWPLQRNRSLTLQNRMLHAHRI